MTTRIIETEGQIPSLVRFIGGMKPPFTVTVVKGKHRTNEQNRLQRLWCNEVAEQLGDQTPEEIRGYCKLTIGVPILRAENEAFCVAYDRLIKPLPHEIKMAYMMEPLDFPVTRIMTTKQKHKYLDEMLRRWSEQGLILTIPDWGLEAMGRTR